MREREREKRASVLLVTVLLLMATTAHAQSYGPPTYSVGDSWKFSDDREAKVVKVDENGVEIVGVLATCPTCRYRLDKNLTILEVLTADGKPVDVTQVSGFMPAEPWKFYDFPLELKKSWRVSAKGSYTGRYGTRFSGYTVDSTVWAYEDVKTKAGTFKAYKIQREWTVDLRSFQIRGTNVVWFAPDVKYIVKFTTTSTDGGDFELVSYSLK